MMAFTRIFFASVGARCRLSLSQGDVTDAVISGQLQV